jgi:hypothetical protein
MIPPAPLNRHAPRVARGILLFALASTWPLAAAAADFDIVIRGGRIVDG